MYVLLIFTGKLSFKQYRQSRLKTFTFKYHIMLKFQNHKIMYVSVQP